MTQQPDDIPSAYADVSSMIEEYSYNPYTCIKGGIKDFIEWFTKYYNVE